MKLAAQKKLRELELKTRDEANDELADKLTALSMSAEALVPTLASS